MIYQITWSYIILGMLVFYWLIAFNQPSIMRVKRAGIGSAIAGCIVITLLWLPAVAVGVLLSIVDNIRGKR